MVQLAFCANKRRDYKRRKVSVGRHWPLSRGEYRFGEATLLDWFGLRAIDRKDWSEAEGYFRESLVIYQEIEERVRGWVADRYRND